MAAKRQPPGKTVRTRENQLINYAVDLAEKQLREGTASAAVITHYLKLATTREKLEQTKLERQNILLEAQTEALNSAADMEKLYAKAIKAMSTYSGNVDDDDSDL